MPSPLENDRVLKTYLNPVYPKSFPDPFVLKFAGEYFGYCTGSAADGNVFGVLRSEDLVTWKESGGAMAPLADSPPYYWAPEVVYHNGKFYLYYSVGNEALMELRVAVSTRPDGGFVDSGRRLTKEDFAIDAHVFVDDDGSKYLFYATDFLDHSYIGTGTVVDKMVDWFTLEGNPRPVTRAKYDWQVYDPNRIEKGGVRWHTVEGPAVLKRKGIYYEMFSGGNWQNTTYGVSFAVSNRIESPDEWLQFSDGENVLPILRTIPEVVGPGHNSIVRGPNNRELFCVYHRWTDEGRVMAIDRMDFAGDRLFLIGATHAPQPAPFRASIPKALSNPATKGDWTSDNQSALSASNGKCEMEFASLPESFLCEFTLQCAGPLTDNGSVEIRLLAGADPVALTFHPIANVMRIEVPEDSTGLTSICKLPEGFDWTAPHLLRVEADFRRLKITLDEASLPEVKTSLASPLESFSISSENQSIRVGAVQLTGGFEELFEEANAIAENGWEVISDVGYRIEDGELLLDSAGEFQARRHWPDASCEFAANFRVMGALEGTCEYGLLIEDGESALVRLSVDWGTSRIRINGESVRVAPGNAVLEKYHQLRIIKTGGRALCYFDDALLHDFPVEDTQTHCSVFCGGTGLGIEMVRITTL
ncbi:MAG TPA: glycoside hydrolase family 43 protein [Pyrinomonadaceae bacterium]|nr:glycoside hydrolase family 43 protein [Pyrinomonadaceae bacterium]